LVVGNFNAFLQSRGPEFQRSATNRGKETAGLPARTRSAVRAELPEGKPRRKRKFPYRRVEEIEADIAAREAEIRSLHDQLTQPQIARNGSQVKAIQRRIGQLQSELPPLYEHWEEASELN
jgi:ATP-binding cassette subfamily F protein 3